MDTPTRDEGEENTLLIEDDSLNLGFTQIPNPILWATNVPGDAKLLYAVLLGYAWQKSRCFPGYERLCSDMGMSENTVRRYMKALTDIGLIRQQRRGLGKTNVYTLCSIPTSKIEVPEPQRLRYRTSKSEVQEPQPLRFSYKNNTQMNNTQNEEDPPKPPKGRAIPPDLVPRSAPQGGRETVSSRKGRRARKGDEPADYAAGPYGVCPRCNMIPCECAS